MLRPSTDPAHPALWALGALAHDPAVRARLERAGLQLRASPQGCSLGLVDLRGPAGVQALAAARADATTRDLLVLALVDDSEPGLRAALDAGADGIVAWSRLDAELMARVELLTRRQHERDLAARHDRDLAALLELTGDFASTRDATELLQKVTRRLANELGILRAALVLFDDAREQGRIVATSDEARTDRVVELAQYPELREVARSGRSLVLPDASNHPLLGAVKEVLAGKAIGAIAAVPVAVQGRVFGALLLRTGEDRSTFSPREMAFASTVAHATAVALRNARLLERAEAQVAALARYEGFFNAFFHGVAVLGARGEVLSLNPAGARLLGVNGPRDVERVLAAQGAATTDAIQELLHRTRQGGPRQEVDVPMLLLDGRKVTLALSAAKLDAAADPDLGHAMLVCFRDVTAARATQLELRRTKEFLERLVDQASDAIIAADRKGQIIVFNRGAERIAGFSPEQAIGHLNVRQLYPDGVAQELMRKIRSPEHGGPGQLEPTRAEIVTRSGERVPVMMTAAVITQELGGAQREVATVGIFSDLRERMRLEATLSQTQEKLQQREHAQFIAELAGTAAHELNQPLTSIMGYAELLRRRLRDDDPQVRAVDIVYREAERMAEIVRKIGKITRHETKAYVGESRIVDLDRAAGEDDA